MRAVACGVMLAAALGGAVPAALAATEPAGAVLVTVGDAAALPAGAREVARIAGLRFATVPVPPPRSSAAHAARLAAQPGILAAEPDVPLRPASSVSGNCVDTPVTVDLETATVAGARTRALPKTTRPIAILDTGVDPSVPELAGRVLAQSEAIAFTPPAARDNDGHGTQVAAAAAGAPGKVAGVSPTSPVMPIRIATASTLATPSTIVKGLEIATDRKARVAVLAYSRLASEVSDQTETSLALAIGAAFTGGLITVVPAGNEGVNVPTVPGTAPHVLTVGSVASSGARDEFSNRGPWVDLVARGANLVLPAPPAICSSGYARASGTSFAAAAVAGGVALIGAARSNLTTPSLYDLVRRSAIAPAGGDGFDVDTGFGQLNVAAGYSATAATTDPREVDDGVYWLRRRANAHPTFMQRSRSVRTRGAVSPGKDPFDVFKVRLRRGERLTVAVTTATATAAVSATVWSPRTAAFGMNNPASDFEVASSLGFANNPKVSYRAPSTGTYYVAIFAPDWTVPGEQGEIGKDVAPLSVPRTAYTLRLNKR